MMKKTICMLLCVVLLCTALPLAAAAQSTDAACGGKCEYYPTIIIPGLGQSSVVVVDGNGNVVREKDGKKASAFPAYLQTDKLVRSLARPLLLSLMLQKDMGLSDAFAKAIDDSFGVNACDLSAQPSGPVRTEKYPYSYARFNDEERETVNGHVPFELYPTDLPRDHLYYFAYNSFGNHIGLADELYAFIKTVQAQTGHKKVNLVPLSQGASIVSAMLGYHPEVATMLHKVLFVVPALDGSKIIGDVFTDRITFLNSDYLYHGFLENMRLLDERTASLLELVLRLLPDEVWMAALKKGVQHLVENVMIRSTGMWALCPSGDYPAAAMRYLSSPEMADIKAQTERYYKVQKNARANIAALKKLGVQVFCMAEYDYALINVGERWNDQNGDFIIQLDSTSMGAVSSRVGETLPADYVQKNTHCKNPNHNHISPDRVVDASAGLLPDTTFYFKGQRHDLTQHNDIILKLAMQLIAHDDITDVYSSPDFPQFNFGRDVRAVRELLAKARGVKTLLLLPPVKKELAGAVAQAEETLNKTVDTADALQKAETRLRKALVMAGAELPEAKKANLFAPASDFFYNSFGSNGYSEIPRVILGLGK